MHFHSRLAWLTFVIMLVALGSSTLVWNASLQQERRRELEDRLLDQARIVAALLPAPSESTLAEIDRTVRLVHGEAQSRITVIAMDGVVLAESDLPPEKVAGMENHRLRPEVVQALERGVGVGTRESATLGIPMAYLALRWGPPDRPYGIVRTSLPLTRVLAEQNQGRERLVLVLLGSLALSGLLGYVAARRISRPVARVSRAARAIAAGDLEQRVKVQGSVEAKELAASVNDLADSVLEEIRAVEGERRRLAQLLEGMPDGILALDEQGRITLANEAAQGLLGPRGVTGLRPGEVVQSAELQHAVDRALKVGQAEVLETTLSDPEQRILAVSLVPLESGLVVVLHDVTRLRRLEAARREMVANIGHELRTPLSAIMGYLETLEQSSHLSTHDRNRFLAVINRNSRRLERLVQDLSRLARLESAQVKLNTEPLFLSEVVEATMETLTPRASSRRITLRSEVDPDLPRVEADRDSLETVLLNLLDNAVRVTPEGETVVVRTVLNETAVQIEVADRGPGVPQELRDRVFERFYRMDVGRSAELGGSGLGLAIVKHIVLLHGGEVGVSDNPGGGAAFHFTLPLVVEPVSGPQRRTVGEADSPISANRSRRTALALLLLLTGCSGGGGAADRPRAISPDSLHAWMEEGRRVVLFDIRVDSLFSRQRLPLAIRAHGAEVSDILELIPVDPRIPMVLYNTDGVRPAPQGDLGTEMIRYGFTSLYWLEGGIEGWVSRGYNVDGTRTFPRK